MNEKIQSLCRNAILLYHVEKMKQQGVLTTEHANKISDMIRESCGG